MPITAWGTSRILQFSDWRTTTQNRVRAKVSMTYQYSRMPASPLPMGAMMLGTGLQRVVVPTQSTLKLADVRQSDARPVICDDLGRIIVTQAGEAIRTF